MARVLLCVVAGSSVLGLNKPAHGQREVPTWAIAGKVDLQRLVDLAAVRLNYAVEYDANALKVVTVELRLDDRIGDDQLWSITNQLLAARGFTTIHTIGAASGSGAGPSGTVFSVVKLSDAAGLARIEPAGTIESKAGFVSAWVTVRHRSMKEVLDAVKALVSKPGGAVQEIGGQGTLLVSDFRPRIERILELVGTMDSAEEERIVDSIAALNLPASELAALVTAAVTTTNGMSPRPLQGRLTATADNRAMILVSPRNEVARWRELVSQFDRAPGTETRTYSVASLSLSEVTALLEQIGKTPGPRGSGDQWRVVTDTMAGLLIITATPCEHKQIAAVIDRLNHLPAEVRRPVRAFPIRNRSVSDIVAVLTKMLESGVLDATMAEPVGEAMATGPSHVTPNDLQRSDRSDIVTSTTMPGDNSTLLQTGGQSGDRTRLGGTDSAAGLNHSSLTLTADEGTNTLIAVGEPRKLAQLEELLRTLDVRQPQVMIEVLVVSLNDGDTLDLGVELEKIEVNGDTVTTIASLFGLGPAAGAVTGKGFTGLILNPGDFRVLIRALQTLNNGRALNMPKVLVSNNQQANLDAVVQQPFVSTNASDTVATTSFGGFENAGTTISVKPQIAKGDHLVLDYSVSLSAFVGESSDPGIPPPRQQNNLQSVVTVPDGYTVVVGGIEIQSDVEAVSQVPFVGNIPVLGELFKNRSRSKSTSRFYVFIRPTVLRQEGFEDLKYLSNVAASDLQIDDGFPEVKPRIIK